MRPNTFAQRLFRLSGLVLALYAVVHVAEQFVRVFWNASSSLHGPLSLAPRIVLLWAPLVLHALSGVWLGFTEQVTASEAAGSRLRAAVARAAGLAALLFLLAHAADFRGATWSQLLTRPAAMDELYATLSSTRFGMPLTAAGYVAGLMAAASYLGYVVYGCLVGFGYVRSESSAKRVSRAVAFAAIGWFVLGLTAVIRAATGTLLPF